MHNSIQEYYRLPPEQRMDLEVQLQILHLLLQWIKLNSRYFRSGEGSRC